MRPLSLTSRWTRFHSPVISAPIPSRRIRAFHSTRPSPFVAEVLAASTGFLNGVHAITGLPWVASIPLTAVIVRMVVAFPLQIYSRVHMRRKGDLAPVLYVHRKVIGNMIQANNNLDKIYMRPQRAEIELRKALEEKTNTLYRKWRVSKWSLYFPMLQIPVWLSLMEGIRSMCGVNLGLLRYLVPLPTKDGQAIVLPGVEQTLANEGALWFPDLLAGDPTGMVPILLGVSIIMNVRLGWKTKSLAEASDYTTMVMARHLFAKTLKEGLTILGLYIATTAYLTSMPVGMMLYWIASTNTATMQSLFLDKYLFASKPVEALTPMHVRVLKPGEKPPPVKPMFSKN